MLKTNISPTLARAGRSNVPAASPPTLRHKEQICVPTQRANALIPGGSLLSTLASGDRQTLTERAYGAAGTPWPQRNLDLLYKHVFLFVRLDESGSVGVWPLIISAKMNQRNE